MFIRIPGNQLQYGYQIYVFPASAFRTRFADGGEEVKMTNFLLLLLLSYTSISIDRTAADPVSIAIVKKFNKQNNLRMNEAPFFKHPS